MQNLPFFRMLGEILSIGLAFPSETFFSDRLLYYVLQVSVFLIALRITEPKKLGTRSSKNLVKH